MGAYRRNLCYIKKKKLDKQQLQIVQERRRRGDMSVLYQCYTASVENHNKFYEKRLKKYVRKSNSPERTKKKQ